MAFPYLIQGKNIVVVIGSSTHTISPTHISFEKIKDAIKKPGALRKELGVKGDKPIPAKKLASAAEKKGVTGQRARLAQTLKKISKK